MMRNQRQAAPSIRFKGFTEDWEQRRLCELGQITTGTTPPTNNIDNYSGDGMAWVTPTDIKKNITTDTAKKLSKKGESIARVVPPGTILVTCIASIGKNTMVSTFASFNQQINSVTPNSENDSYFLLTQSEIWSQKMKQIASSGTMQIVNKSEFSKLEVNVPSLEEQKKIGAFFKQLDTTITLQQQQLDNYREWKKALLQKMFPKDGEKIPEIRFEGFAGEWEERKFGELWEKSSERNNDLKYSTQDILSVSKMKLNSVERKSTSDYLKTYNILHYGDIAFEGNKSKHHSFGRFVLNDVQDGMVSHVFITFRPKVEMDVDFMKIYINNENVMKHHLVKATTKTLMMTTLNVMDVNKQVLVIPILEEQSKIGAFFKQLDDTITLHQNQLDNYKELKKAMLQNLFI